jgi:hypothetical protein
MGHFQTHALQKNTGNFDGEQFSCFQPLHIFFLDMTMLTQVTSDDLLARELRLDLVGD